MDQAKRRPMNPLHAMTTQRAILDKDSNQIGTLVNRVEISQINNVDNLYGCKSYIVVSRQRVSVPGCGWVFCPQTLPKSSGDYPAVLVHAVTPSFPENAVVQLLDYSPKTINTAVVTSNSVDNGSSSSSMKQYSSGSSTSQTNSYDVSESVGFFGDAPVGNIGSSSATSNTSSSFNSTTTGSGMGKSRQNDASASMTIKDWGGYASLDSSRSIPTWTWVQEYPWNALEYVGNSGNNINLPQSTCDLLAHIDSNSDNSFVFPPSHLSVYGIDFVTTVSWKITVPQDQVVSADEVISFDHDVTLYQGNHSISSNQVSVCLTDGTSGTVSIESIDGMASKGISMPLLGLDPITAFEPGNGAIVGFVPRQMLYGPDATTGNFRVLSENNTLYITGRGFAPFTGGASSVNQDQVMTTLDGLSPQAPAVLNIYFKISEKAEDIALHMKHWRTSAQGVMLTLSINNSETFIRHVDATSASNGSGNVTTVTLCNRDIGSIDYFDYLNIGLNCITITIQPSNDYTGGACGYALRAIGIA